MNSTGKISLFLLLLNFCNTSYAQDKIYFRDIYDTDKLFTQTDLVNDKYTATSQEFIDHYIYCHMSETFIKENKDLKISKENLYETIKDNIGGLQYLSSVTEELIQEIKTKKSNTELGKFLTGELDQHLAYSYSLNKLDGNYYELSSDWSGGSSSYSYTLLQKSENESETYFINESENLKYKLVEPIQGLVKKTGKVYELKDNERDFSFEVINKIKHLVIRLDENKNSNLNGDKNCCSSLLVAIPTDKDENYGNENIYYKVDNEKWQILTKYVEPEKMTKEENDKIIKLAKEMTEGFAPN